MKKFDLKKIFIYVTYLVSVGSYSVNSFAISKNLLQSLKWEFFANSANRPSDRKDQHVDLLHYDVPVKILSKGFTVNPSDKLKNSLFFEKRVNGVKETFLRWIINPEDTKHHLKIKGLLEKKGYDSNPKKYFVGHLTASRSIYIEDPNTGYIFSGKVSTDHTGGKWTEDKKLNNEDVVASMHSSKLARRVGKVSSDKFETLKLISEPYGFFIQGSYFDGILPTSVKQGFIIRDLEPINNGNYYLPGFSALHEKVGREIAKKNGSENPMEFWTKHYVEPVARANAELTGLHGLSLTSAHNQQYLVELDSHHKPTGKIVIRDFNDSHRVAPFYSGAQNEEDQELKKFYRRQDKMLINFGLFHGTDIPSWIRPKDEAVMVKAFYKAFEARFSEISGVPLSQLSFKKPTVKKSPRYSVKSYDLENPFTKAPSIEWIQYFAAGDCFRGQVKLKDGRLCSEVLKELTKYVKEKNSSTGQPGNGAFVCKEKKWWKIL